MDNIIISFKDIILILVAHFIGDFILQTNNIANNKSHSIKHLCAHGVLYIIPFAVIFFDKPIWFIFNCLVHIIIDFFTSKITTFCWHKKKIRFFFNTIGFDQMIHLLILIFTFITMR